MKAIAILYRGGLLLLCSLMLFLMAPQLVWAQEELPTPEVTEPTLIEEGAPPAVRRKRTRRLREKDVGTRSPKEPWTHDTPPPEIEEAEATDPDVDIPLGTTAPDDDDAASKAAALASRMPTPMLEVAERDIFDSEFELGLDGVISKSMQEAMMIWIAETSRTDVLEAPMPEGMMEEAPSKPMDAKLAQDGPEFAVVGEEMDVPDAFALEANYPNPFNPETTIRFALPETAQVRIQVFDLLGREVALLVNGTLTAGRHQVVFDAQDLASGLYVYRMDAGTFVQNRTMLLMK